MYSYQGESCIIHHNSDMSGNIRIIQRDGNEGITVYGEDILNFVANYIRSEKIGKLEQMDWKEILK